MQCPECGKQLIVENTDPSGKTKRVKCAGCGFSEVIDEQGRKLLTDTMPPEYFGLPPLNS